jgi:SAM-dependent methyltransferase
MLAVGDAIPTFEDNVEATAAWDGPLFDIWLQYRPLIEESLGPHGEAALALHPPPAGGQCLDIGCGLGDTTFRMAELVGPEGRSHGVDVAPRMIEVAQQDLERAGTPNVSFAVADVESDDLGGTYDYAFGRCGTMFFANPVPAFRNVRSQLAPGGLLNIVVWRRKLDNDWLHKAELIVKKYLDKPDETDEPTCGPGPFAMANADTVSDMVKFGGYEDIRLARCDLPYKMGDDLDQAVAFNMAIGPAAEVLRLWGDRVDDIRPTIEAELYEGLEEFVTEDGSVVGPSSTWIVTGRAPG